MLFAATGLAILIGVGTYAYMTTRPIATPETYVKAKATETTAKCLAADATLTIPDDEHRAIELSAVSYLVDVPAGTEVDVRIATYSDNKVTGSDHYPDKYGNYNFAMDKRSEGWVVTDFERCE